ncbi:MAG: ABC transporter ATP-binding protein [Patescibacteria group bacterium]|nr:ABC transporter ATP-binding protein [Patescibacteria group bacterium]
MANAVIEIENLTKYYGSSIGVQNLNFSVSEGEIFGFLGPNGAGKTTTIRLLLNLLYPTSGTAKIFDLDCVKDSLKVREELGYLAGDPNLYPTLSGKTFLDFIDSFRPEKKSKYRRELTTRLNLDAKRKIKQYSRGNLQKLGIIQALMHKPKLAILDEPSSGLDPLVQLEFYKILEELKKEGKTIFLSSHNLSEVEKICDRVAIIRQGKIVAVESIEKIRHRSIRVAEVFFKAEFKKEDFKFDNVKIIETGEHYLKLQLPSSMINQVLAKLAKYEVHDLSFTTPDLEEIFLQYYEK